MGEMADFTNEQVQANCEAYMLYQDDGMSDQDAYDAGIIDEMGFLPPAVLVCPGDYPGRRFRRAGNAHQLVTCKYCGGAGFVWKQFDGAWRLANPGGTMHDCPHFRLDEVCDDHQDTEHGNQGRS
jgi:hypothetical protein